MNVVLIPCWKRPEFLHICLDNLTKCEGIKDVHVIFRPDRGFDPDNLKVIDHFRQHLGSFDTIHTDATSYTDGKQSYSLLTGYHIAANISSDLVFMVEEDVMVSRDFLKYHQRIHAQEPNLFCSLSTKNHNRRVSTTDNPRSYYLTHLDYCSLGVSLKKEIIQEHITTHISSGYFRSPHKYVRTMFRGSCLNGSMCEQDGLIRRIQERHPELPIAYPHVPRAYHAGYYGYNRPRKVTGTLEQRIAEATINISSPERMRLASLGPEYYADSEPVELEVGSWQTLTRQQPPELENLGYT